MTEARDFGSRLKDCIIQVLVGEKLGGGISRTVFALDDKRVLKVEHSGQHFANHAEWKVWQEVGWTKWAKWFAPCLDIDAFGSAMIQARTTPMSEREWAKLAQVPNFMSDLKRENWGMLNGKPVCHDYALNLLIGRGLSGARLVKKRD